MTIRVGVLGATGRLGRWLVAKGAEPIACDITDFSSINTALASRPPFDVIVNCAAYTNVDDAEKKENQDKVIRTNYKAITFILASLTPKCHLVHLSTDYVFGGKRGPYTERMKFVKSDAPVNFYGLTKQAAEMVLFDFPRTTVVRTTGLFGSGDWDFVEMVRCTIENDTPISVADDLMGNVTHIPFLAGQLLHLCSMENKPGLIHLASSDVCTRYELAVNIAQMLGKSDMCLNPVHSKDIWDVPRPARGGLDIHLAIKLGFNYQPIRSGLRDYLEKLN